MVLWQLRILGTVLALFASVPDAKAQVRAPGPVSYIFVTDMSKPQAELTGAARYHGGKIRVIFVDGRPLKLPQAAIVSQVRSGYLVPVYTDSRERLSREDWIASLPNWLGVDTVTMAGPRIPPSPER